MELCCRQGVMPALAEAAAGARVIAFDRPPFGLTQRPLVWEGAEEDNPYTSPVRNQRYIICIMGFIG